MIFYFLYLLSLVFEKTGFDKNKIPVLLYHSIDESGNPYSVSLKDFKKQIALLYKKGYGTINLSELKSYLKNKKFPKKKILITFDDGYKNNLELAKPVLDKYGFSGVIFIATSLMGGEIQKNDKSYKMLSKEDLIRLEKSSWDIANHFHSHKILTDLSEQEIVQEIKESKKILKDLLNKKENLLSFVCPKDKINRNIVSILIKKGANMIFTGEGLISKKTDYYNIPRVEVFNNTDKYKFLLRLSWFYHKLKKNI